MLAFFKLEKFDIIKIRNSFNWLRRAKGSCNSWFYYNIAHLCLIHLIILMF